MPSRPEAAADGGTADRIWDEALLAELEEFSTPAILNGLKRLGVDSADLQTMDRHAIRCTSPDLGPRVGVAATRLVGTRRSGGPADESRTLALTERSERDIAVLPSHRFLVVQNVGDWFGSVCIWGEVMAHVNLAIGCRSGVTNGPVRDIPEMEALGFQSFAGGPGVGGGYVDLLDVSRPVLVGGVTVEHGDLLHGDRHGVAKIPARFAADLPEAIRSHEAVERRVIALCETNYSARAVADAWRRPIEEG